jgi:hypothetical protein
MHYPRHEEIGRSVPLSAGYRRIELASRKGKPGSYTCALCKQPLEVFDGSSEIAYRLTVTPTKYLNVEDESA